MPRYRYNQQVYPPAPFVYVALLRPTGDQSIPGVPAQLDTAADRTVIPLRFVEELRLIPLDEMTVIGFGGNTVKVRTFSVGLSLRGGEAVTLEVFGTGNEPHILLGRDTLNRYRILFDGPQLILEID